MKKLTILSLLIISAFAYPSCFWCHNGIIQNRLSNLTPKEIITKMHEFKHSTGSMANIAKKMNDDEIKKVAKEYGEN